jgi:hypothetical protein
VFGEGWEEAQATVVASKALLNWSHQGEIPHEYVLDVRSKDGEVFRATTHTPLMHGSWKRLSDGQTVNVLCKPKSHEVKLSDEYKDHWRQAEHEQAEQFKAISAAAPGSPATVRAPKKEHTGEPRHLKMDPTERLLKVTELHAEGVLSDDEFARAKAQILGG